MKSFNTQEELNEFSLNNFYKITNTKFEITEFIKQNQGKYLYLRGADLRRANLCYANLRGARLLRTNLIGAALHRANLYYTDLNGADLIGVDLRVANLRGARLRRVSLRGASLHGARYNKNTIFPNGFNPTANDMIYTDK